MSTKAQSAANTSSLTAAVEAGRGGFRSGVSRPADIGSTMSRVGGFFAGGMQEFKQLYTKTQFEGATWTAKDELRKDAEYVAEAESTAGKLMRAGQTGGQLVGVMLTITLAAAIGFVGVKINSEVEDSITDKDLSATADENQTVYENASESVSGGYTDAMGLTDIVFLVLMFGVILGALLAFRGQR